MVEKEEEMTYSLSIPLRMKRIANDEAILQGGVKLSIPLRMKPLRYAPISFLVKNFQFL